jgi:hypothetical protein
MSEAQAGAGGAENNGEGGAAAGGEGAGAAALLNGGEAGGGESGGATGGEGGGQPWFAALPDEDRAWAQNKAYADLPTAIKSYRELEAQFLKGEKLVVPKEGDPQDVFDRFYQALGRPEAAEKYEITAPEGHQLDESLVATVRDAAFKAGVPQTMLQPMVEAFNNYALEQIQHEEAQRIDAKNKGVDQIKAEWGDNFQSRLAEANRAMRVLELSTDDIGSLEDALGTVRVMQLMHRLGAGMGEDALRGGSTIAKFAISPAEAKAELDRIETDPDKIKAYAAGDKALRERAGYLRTVIAQSQQQGAA